MPLINYQSIDGKTTQVDVAVGLTVMHGAVINMVEGILAECGGAMTCATCHCYIEQSWRKKIGFASAQERIKLKLVKKPKANSRLSCQIKVTEELDGLTVLIPDSQVWSKS